MTYDEKMKAIQDGVEKGLAALEIAIKLIERAVPFLEGYRDLIRSDYEGRKGISGSFKDEYEALLLLIEDIKGKSDESNPT